MSISLAVLGGSGLYHMQGLTDIEEHDLTTPFGKPSDPVVVGTLNNQRVAFLARHGKGHRFSPTEVNYRANISALKMLGAERVVSVSACGSLREDYAPGHIVIPDQIFDFTKGRERSFFGGGLVAHVGTADPFCPTLSAQLYEAVKATGAPVHRGGNFITIEGPRFSTKAESRTFRQEPMPLQRSFSRVVLWVPEQEEGEALRVLAENEANGEAAATCTVCGGPMDDAVCPACAEEAPPVTEL